MRPTGPGADARHAGLEVGRPAGSGSGQRRHLGLGGLGNGIPSAQGGAIREHPSAARPAGVRVAPGGPARTLALAAWSGSALVPGAAAPRVVFDGVVGPGGGPAGGAPALPAGAVSRETSTGTTAGPGATRGEDHPLDVVRDHDQVRSGADPATRVSRETSPHEAAAGLVDTRRSSAVAVTGQTSPVQSEQQGEDGSARMQQRSGATGATTSGAGPSWGALTTAPYGYEDRHRVDLVESLPRVDDSTPLAVEVAEDARRRISLVGRPFPIPPRTRILTVANQKGGVGKTTTTVNVAAAMAQSGLNVLVLDIDPQGNASTALGIDHHSDIPSLYDVVVEQRPLSQVLQSCREIPNLYCAPATIDLAGAEIELVSLVAREVRLQKALRDYLDDRVSSGLSRIDYVFVDCPPSLSLLTVNAFVAADEVFIPIQCEYYALEGLSQLLKHVELIRGHLNPTLHVSSILLTMYDSRTRLSSQVADEVRAHFPETVLRTTVPRSVRISEAPSHGQTVMTYDPASSGALSYLEAARELAEQVLTWAGPSQQEEQA